MWPRDLRNIAAVFLLPACIEVCWTADLREFDPQNGSTIITTRVAPENDPHFTGLPVARVCFETVSSFFQLSQLPVRRGARFSLASDGGEPYEYFDETVPASLCEELDAFDEIELDNFSRTNPALLQKIKNLTLVCNSLVTLRCDGKKVGGVGLIRTSDPSSGVERCLAPVPAHFFFGEPQAESTNPSIVEYEACTLHTSSESSNFTTYRSKTDKIPRCSPIRGSLIGESSPPFPTPHPSRLNFNSSYPHDDDRDDILIELPSAYCASAGVPHVPFASTGKPATADCDFLTAVSINGSEFFDYNEMKPELSVPGYTTRHLGSGSQPSITHSALSFKGTSGSIVWCADKKTRELYPLYMATGMMLKGQAEEVAPDLINGPEIADYYGMSLGPIVAGPPGVDVSK